MESLGEVGTVVGNPAAPMAQALWKHPLQLVADDAVEEAQSSEGGEEVRICVEILDGHCAVAVVASVAAAAAAAAVVLVLAADTFWFAIPPPPSRFLDANCSIFFADRLAVDDAGRGCGCGAWMMPSFRFLNLDRMSSAGSRRGIVR